LLKIVGDETILNSENNHRSHCTNFNFKRFSFC